MRLSARRLSVGLLTLSASVGFAIVGMTPAHADPAPPPEQQTVGNGQEQTQFLGGVANSVINPHVAPAGANDWNCKPSAAHPRPVVLVHGTWVNEYNSFARLSPELQRAGYCVFAAVYGQETRSLIGKLPFIRGTDAIAKSGKDVATFVDAVLAHTGTKQVDMIGFSLGGPIARQYLRFDGGANRADPSKNKVKRVITIAGTNHGTTLDGSASLTSQVQNLGLPVNDVQGALLGQASVDQQVGSDGFRPLGGDGDTDPGIEYTVIATRFDEVSTPPQMQFLAQGTGATVHNLWVQDGCSSDFSDHASVIYNPRTTYIVENALDPGSHPIAQAPCALFGPIIGNGR